MIAVGCQRTPTLVKIGLIGPFEGRHRSIGYDVIYSARLAIRELNRSGGIGDYRFALVALDDFGDPEMSQQAAAAMVVDSDVVIVIGHWLQETTESASPIYERSGLAFLPVPSSSFAVHDPSQLPGDFLAKYAETTPFDEVAGLWAGTAYDAMQLAIEAISESWMDNGIIDRAGVLSASQSVVHSGLTGEVAWP